MDEATKKAMIAELLAMQRLLSAAKSPSRRARDVTTLTKTCVSCGALFTTTRSYQTKCKRDCGAEARHAKCAHCGNEFRQMRGAAHVYCSHDCRRAARAARNPPREIVSVPRICQYCERTFNSRAARRYCSPKCGELGRAARAAKMLQAVTRTRRRLFHES